MTDTPAPTCALPEGKIRILLAPCGCMAAADATTTIPGFCRSRQEAEEDLADGFHEATVDQAELVARSMRCEHEPQWGVAR